jgi:hypothetical protein
MSRYEAQGAGFRAQGESLIVSKFLLFVLRHSPGAIL